MSALCTVLAFAPTGNLDGASYRYAENLRTCRNAIRLAQVTQIWLSASATSSANTNSFTEKKRMMKSSAEEWKDIPGYEGLYQVSSQGRILSLERWVSNPLIGLIKKPACFIVPQASPKGYLHVGLYKDGKAKSFNVHRLVAEVFIPNPELLPQVDHINADKTDNRIENLRWVTAKQNIRNPLNMEHLIGERNPFFGKRHSLASRQKMSAWQRSFDRFGAKNPAARSVRNLDTGEIFETVKAAGRQYGVSDNSIRNSITRNTKSAGFHWEYV